MRVRIRRLAVMQELERSVLGCDYGGTSWTTRLEADRIARVLELDPKMRLLDVARALDGLPCISPRSRGAM